MSEVKMCACGDRPADQCDEEWGPNCDLGNNLAHARVSPLPPVLLDQLKRKVYASKKDSK